jgi:hypothetical protein
MSDIPMANFKTPNFHWHVPFTTGGRELACSFKRATNKF